MSSGPGLSKDRFIRFPLSGKAFQTLQVSGGSQVQAIPCPPTACERGAVNFVAILQQN
ncbi:hypothetical protein GCM10011503_11210 [Henriciella pelagia]|uniref:Uncharacterized protein n=1 Tax=Henriciella pelagia TaxID=1977912 RepID=A0ABQ1JAM5_9PROT|nr:hypothetical protein GCM10011503_11210 [Henriciella pelagia]